MQRTGNVPLEQANTLKSDVSRKMRRSIFRSKKRLVRYGIIAMNALVLLSVAALVIASQPSGSQLKVSSASRINNETIVDPLDELSSADIAVQIAQLARLDEATAVSNNADTINSKLDIVPADSQIVAKPQIVATDHKSITDLISYVSVEGDTLTSVAQKFNVSKDTVKWSNNISAEALAVGTTLTIPPIDGILYTIKDGDTAEKIAEKYKSDVSKIIAFNDAEISGLVKDQKIVIPNGTVPVSVVRSVPSYAGFRFGSSAVYGYNGYVYGYCTWYAANRRADVGRPVPANLGNASTWKVLSQRAGIAVGNTPQKHAVIWTPPRDYYGHVAFVEEVYADGSILISEMNTVGWGVRSERTLTAAQAAGYSYIY